MIPTRRLLAITLGWGVLGAVPSLWPALAPTWLGLGAGLALLALGDTLALRVVRRPTARRTLRHTLALGVGHDVHLEVANLGRTTLHLRVHDSHPVSMTIAGLPRELTLRSRQSARVDYRLTPTSRGVFEFGSVQLAMCTRLGLFERRVDSAAAATVRVFPDFAAVAGLALLAAQDRSTALGIHQQRRRGAGVEFQELRDYRDGDLLRQIDWKATSRRRRLICREFQEARDQQVVFLLDCSRRMRSHDGNLSHFDHSLNALLLLAHVALRQGDAVAVGTFGGEQRWLMPRKGPAAMRSLIRHLFDLQTTLEPADYAQAGADLLTQVPRRALVVLLTNLRDEDDRTVTAAVRVMGRRHLVLLADLREAVVDELANAPVHNLQSAVALAAARGFLAQRERLHAQLRGSGAQLLSCRPRDLAVALTNRYLALKRSGAI